MREITTCIVFVNGENLVEEFLGMKTVVADLETANAGTRRAPAPFYREPISQWAWQAWQAWHY